MQSISDDNLDGVTGNRAQLSRSKRPANYVISSDEDEDLPLSQLAPPSPPPVPKKRKVAAASKPKKAPKIISDDTKNKPKAAKKEPKSEGTKPKKPVTPRASSAAKTGKAKSVKAEPLPSQAIQNDEIKSETPASSQIKLEEDEENFKWWETNENGNENSDIKWETLEHNGVVFPPPYEPIPLHVKLYYDNKPVKLLVEAEEVAGFFAALLESDHAKNPVFQKNFFTDFQAVIKETKGSDVDIKDFKKLDFSKMHAYFEQLRVDKQAMLREEKKQAKLAREAFEEPYKTCLLNGRRETVGNFRIEPPGLFRGRGAHPKTGKLKRRVPPEAVTLNLGATATVPPPPEGHLWGEVRHDNSVMWLAMWKENIADNTKYVYFAANSSVKGQLDFRKFETARKLRHHIDAIRADYTRGLKAKEMVERQKATATYLIDIYALRAGGEKGEDEADTVGCCSLRYEHISLQPPNTVIFDFLGKDSIRFYQEVQVEKQVFKNLCIFKKEPKGPGDDLFDRITPTLLNKHFQNYMPGLTAKVFRTYNASKTMQDQINLIKNEGSVLEKVVKFNAANRTVAILCNHQRTVSKTHGSSVEKIHDKLLEMEWQKIRLKRNMLALDPGLRAKDRDYFAEIDDLLKEDEAKVHKIVIERTREQTRRKFERENEKLLLENKPVMAETELKERLAAVDDLEKQYAKELRTGKIEEIKRGLTQEKLRTQCEAVEKRILTTTVNLKDKQDNSEVSLGTSKMNYIDPRLTVMFSKKFDVPLEKLFSKTLREKFNWAVELADADWQF